LRVHEGVGLVQDIADRGMALRVIVDRARAEPQAIFQPVLCIEIIHRRLKTAQHAFYLDRRGGSSQYREFIATDSRDQIRLPTYPFEHIGKGLQCTVALGMPEPVIDLLEAVEVEKKQ